MDIPSYILGRIKGSGGAGVNYVVVDELPTTGEEGKIYLVPKEDSQTDNVYNEYMYIEDEWELIGDTQADLSNYQTLLSTTNKLNADYIDDSESTNKLTNATEKATWNGKQDVIQYSAMPTASATNVGKIVQFTGTTDSTYTNGYFYQCVSDGEATPTYSWSNINVQNAGASMYVEDNNGLRTYFVRYSTTNADMYSSLTDFIKNWKSTPDNYNIRKKPVLAIFGNAWDKAGFYSTDSIYPSSIEFINGDTYHTKITTNSNGNLIYNKYTTLTISFNSTTYEVTGIQWGNTDEDKTNFLGLTNTTSYTPTGNYNPATKKYVDDSIASAIGTALQGNY